jgi:capsular polysaccharide biosynthesis protein
MDVRGWLLFVRDWFAVLAMGMVLAGVAAFAVSSVLPKTYEASATLLVGQSLTAPNPDYSQLLASQIIAQTYAEIATARPTLDGVISALGLEVTPEELREAVTARAPANSTFVIVTASDSDPARAAAVADAVSQALLDMVSDAGTGVTEEDLTRLDAEIDTVTARIDDLLARDSLTTGQETTLSALRDQVIALRAERAEVLAELTGSSNRLSVIEPATVPDEPVAPRVLLNTAIGAFLGLVIATLAGYGFESAVRPEAQARRSAPPAAPYAGARSR